MLVGTLTTATSQTWANPDGTFSSDIASGPVRVPDAADPAGWTPIDTTLEAASGGFQPVATVADVTFSAGGDTTAASLDVGSRSFDVKWPNPLPRPTVAGDTATYPDVLPGVDLTLRATSTGFEHSFVLTAPPTQALTIVEPLGLTGTKATVDAAGNLSITDTGGRVLAQASRALMFDATIGDHSGMSEHITKVATKIVNTKSGPALQLSPDQAFMTDSANVYPITIDPTVDLSVSKDTYVELQHPDQSYGSDNDLKTGAISSGGTEKARSLIQFGIGSISGTHVTSATLKLWNNYSYSCTNKLTDIYNVTSSWSGPTWNNQPTYGAVYSSKSFAYGYSGSCPAQTVSFTGGGSNGKTMTDLVQGWASGSINNYGLSVRADDETNLTTWKLFNSSDAASHVPVLSVTYNSYPNTPTGLSPATGTYQATSQPTLHGKFCDPDGGKGRVNFEVRLNSNGNLVVSSSTTRAKVNSCTDHPWTVPASNLTNGTTYKWRAQGDDGTDVSSWTSYRTFTVDTTGPSTPTVSSSTHPSQTAWYASSQMNFTATWTASTDGTSGLAGYAEKCDRNPTWTPTGALQTLTTYSCVLSPPGTWYFHVAAQDHAGNWGAVATYAVHIGGLLTPSDGDRTTGTFTLQAQGDPAKANATIQFRRSPADSWANIPDGPSGDVTDSGGTHITWPVSLDAQGSSNPYAWNAAATLGGVDGPVELRVQFGTTNPDYSAGIDVALEKNSFGDEVPLGPGQVNLVTGNFTLGAADVGVWGLGVFRSYDSRDPSSGGMFGPGWSSGSEFSIPYTSLHETSTGAITIHEPGTQLDFVQAGSGSSTYTPVAATDARFTLTKSGGTFTLTETADDGSQTVTTFTQPSAGVDYVPVSYATPGTQGAIAATYEVVAGVARPTQILDEIPTGMVSSYCSGSPGSWTAANKGCRALTFTYATTTTATGTSSGQWGDIANQLKTVSFTGWDPAAGGGSGAMTTTAMASYLYDWSGSVGRLRAVWDPRISPSLKTTYDYDSSGHVTTLSPPGLNAWTITYGAVGIDTNTGRVLSVSRPGVPSGTETTSVVYNVAISGTGAPYAMSSADIALWAQSPTEAPRFATAIFPPGHVPANPPGSTDWPWAAVTYLDNDGRTVNTAQSDGNGGGYISTTEFDQWGHTVRTLTPANRAVALASADSAETATTLDTQNVYSSDGTMLLDTYEPQHIVQLASDGSIQPARAHTHYVYTGAPPGDPYLPTTVTEGAILVGATSDVDIRTTTMSYDNSLFQPTITTVDPSGLSIATKTVYDQATGQVSRAIMPAGYPNGGDAHETDYIYFTGDASSGDAACNNIPAWAGLLCKTKPAAQPTSGNNLPVTTLAYDLWGNVTIKTETVSSPSATRTTTSTYDGAGRLQTISISGPGTTVPNTGYGYGSTTGLPTTSSTSSLTITRHYDALGRLDSYTDADSNTSTYAYDLQDRPTSIYDGKGTYTLSYDEGSERRGHLTTISDSQAGSFGATYDADGALISQTYPNGMAASAVVDETGAPVSLIYTKTSNCSADCDWFTDQVIPSIHGEWLAQNSSLSSQQYSYDADGRLTQVQDTVAAQCTTRQYEFAGSAGLDSNRTKLTTIPPNSDGTCGSSGASVSSTYDEADRATKSGYTFDAFGRVTQIPAADNGGVDALSLSYFANDRVGSLTKGSTTESITIDPSSRERQLTTSSATQTWHYDSDSDSPSWVAENSSGTSWTRNIIGPNAQLVSLVDQAGSSVLQLTNLHGDVVGNASSSQTATSLVSAGDQTEFGSARSGTSARYSWLGGQERATDAATGALFMGARVYLPSVGRFTQVDPVSGGSANAYDYGRQDPLSNVDLNGTWTITLGWTSFGFQVTKTTARNLANFFQYLSWGGIGACMTSVNILFGYFRVIGWAARAIGNTAVSAGLCGLYSSWILYWAHHIVTPLRSSADARGSRAVYIYGAAYIQFGCTWSGCFKRGSFWWWARPVY